MIYEKNITIFIILFSLSITLFGENTTKLKLYKACDNGDAKVCFNRGVMYENGLGVQQDGAKAVELFDISCNGGYVPSCSHLGVMYENGFSIQQDKIKALELFQKACNGGDAQGCFNLGTMYFNGDGIRKDKTKSIELLWSSLRYAS